MDEPEAGRAIAPNRAARRDTQGFRPSCDPVFHYLMEQALAGKLAVHRAVVPLRLIYPYDASYHPQDLPIGRLVIGLVIREWERGASPVVRVYPDKDRFVLSDDYVYFEAALKAKRPDLHCLVLGEADHPGVREIEGPLPRGELKRALEWI